MPRSWLSTQPAVAECGWQHAGWPTARGMAASDFSPGQITKRRPTATWDPVIFGTSWKRTSRNSFPRCPWALDLSDKPFPGRGPQPNTNQLGGWYWESGFDHDSIEKAEYIRDWNFRAMYGAWDALKNVDGLLANYKPNWAAVVAGKRESRRLLGDHVLTEEDVVTGKPYPDGCVPTGWLIDLHLPDERYVKGFEGDAFISKANYTKCPLPYWVPYRCLYSRNIANLFMAGRDISVTHEALGTIRVMRTGVAWAKSSAWPPRSARSTIRIRGASIRTVWTNFRI